MASRLFQQEGRLNVMNDSSVNALLFCNDAQLLCTVDRVFTDGGVLTDVCLGYEGVKESLKKDNFDLLAIDLDEPEAAPVIDLWTLNNPTKVVIAFALQVQTMRQAQRRIHFTLQKPLSASLLGRTLKAARGTLLQKRRSAPRHPVKISAKVCVVQNSARQPRFREMLLDLSAGGVCMKTEPAVPTGANVEIEFAVPGSKSMVHAKGTVMWSESTGVSGVKFTFIPPAELAMLKAWSDSAANVATSMPANLAATLAASDKGYARK
jgi:PilZ domain